MTRIQITLITLSLMTATVASVAFHFRLARRMLAVLFFLVVVLFVALPDTTGKIAQFVGVGRGTDLLVYIVIFAGLHSLLLLYIRLRDLERKLTKTIRMLAINAVKGPISARLVKDVGDR